MNFQVREHRSFREHARDSDQRVLSVRMCKRAKFSVSQNPLVGGLISEQETFFQSPHPSTNHNRAPAFLAPIHRSGDSVVPLRYCDTFPLASLRCQKIYSTSLLVASEMRRCSVCLKSPASSPCHRHQSVHPRNNHLCTIARSVVLCTDPVLTRLAQ